MVLFCGRRLSLNYFVKFHTKLHKGNGRTASRKRRKATPQRRRRASNTTHKGEGDKQDHEHHPTGESTRKQHLPKAAVPRKGEAGKQHTPKGGQRKKHHPIEGRNKQATPKRRRVEKPAPHKRRKQRKAAPHKATHRPQVEWRGKQRHSRGNAIWKKGNGNTTPKGRKKAAPPNRRKRRKQQHPQERVRKQAAPKGRLERATPLRRREEKATPPTRGKEHHPACGHLVGFLEYVWFDTSFFIASKRFFRVHLCDFLLVIQCLSCVGERFINLSPCGVLSVFCLCVSCSDVPKNKERQLHQKKQEEK